MLDAWFAPGFNRDAKLSFASVTGFDPGLKTFEELPVFCKALKASGVERPEPEGEGVGWREGYEYAGLDGAGACVLELLALLMLQSSPFRSSMLCR